MPRYLPGDRAPEAGAGDGFMGLMKGLEKEEILEVLSDEGEGFCQNCQALLLTRLLKVIDKSKISFCVWVCLYVCVCELVLISYAAGSIFGLNST